ncbi:PP2C family protein-serine/threonine phosphatase [Candidatus Spongiihabitans sp.]|uniref:PP2C family protein-serine/threonine phosphatase n=1 Tax=Candidatus Spongiihabitans sp. TaxID=3101308 RepID=UPI003C7BED98
MGRPVLKREKDFSGCAAQGKRERQEDFYAFFPVNANTTLAVLADGMGGHAGGADAAEISVKEFISSFSASCDESTIPQLSTDMLHAANCALAAKIREDNSLTGMGCTLIATLLHNDTLHWISVGDSLLYIFMDEQLQKINADHSLGGLLDQAVMEGKISSEDAKINSQRHALRSALMGEDIALVDENSIAWDGAAPPIIVVASDGLLTLTQDEIADCLHSMRQQTASDITAALVAKTESRGAPHQDNVTVLAIKPPPSP